MSHPLSFAKRFYIRLNGLYEWLTQTILRSSLADLTPKGSWVQSVRAAVLTVAVMTLIILPIHIFIQPHNANISLLYLPAIIWLAATDGLRAAILTSIFATLTYEYFFLDPIYQLNIEEPSEWISLGSQLLVSLVIAFFTVELRRREQYAAESQRRTITLYKFSQEIATTPKLDILAPYLTQQFCEHFRMEGIQSCALWLPQGSNTLTVSAISYAHSVAPPQPYESQSYQAQAALAFQSGCIGASVEYSHATYFIPLKHSIRNEGVLSISGLSHIASLLIQIGQDTGSVSQIEKNDHLIAAEQFAAFCDQVALALERAHLQQEVIAVEALQESDRLKDALLGSISHDLRTPITAIQTASGSLQQKSVFMQDIDYAMLTEKIMGSARRLGSIVDNLLLLTRIEGNAATIQLAMYPINDVVSIALDEMDVAGQLAQHGIMIDIAEDPLEVLIDHSAIERVIINLVENAVKYSPPQSLIRITAERQVAQQRVLVRVIDQGIGIPVDELQTIFMKFHRIHQPLPWSPYEFPKGTGLGLAVCAGIIQEHHGTIWAEPAPQGGTIFGFHLPTAKN